MTTKANIPLEVIDNYRLHRVHFSNVGQWLDFIDNHVYLTQYANHWSGPAQYGVNALNNGITTYTALIEQFATQIWPTIENTQRIWQHSVAGGYPDVGAFLAGDPECMYVQSPEPTETSPLHVFVSLSSAGGIDAQTIARYGAAIAVFAQAMSNIRQTTITLYSPLYSGHRYGDVSVFSVDIATSPLNLAELQAILCYEPTNRTLRFATNGAIVPDSAHSPAPFYRDAKTLRKVLNAQEDDLLLFRLDLGDPLLDDPIKQINRWIEQYSGQSNEGVY